MDNTGGAISFEFLVETGMLERAAAETVKTFKNISNESAAAGKGIDSFFGATSENVNLQKSAIKTLEESHKALRQEIDKISPGKAQYELIKQAKEAKVELDREIDTLNQMEAAVKKNDTAHVSFRTQLRNVREGLIEMEMAGKRGTAEYKALQDEAGRLTDAMGDAQAQANILAHDQRGLQGVISGISGVAGGFSAAQGAIGLFVGENENLQKIMLKVQSLMAITIGLQQIQQTLDKDSAFMIVTLVKIKEIYAAAINRVSVALGVSNVAAKALTATLTLGLSAAIGAVIYLTERYISKQREAAKKQEEFSKSVVDEAYKAVASIEKLSAKWNSLGDNLKAQEKFIADNAKAFDDLGAAVKGVADAEKILNAGKEDFIKAQLEKAKSVAASALAAEKWKEWLLNKEKLDSTPELLETREIAWVGVGERKKNKKYVKLDEEGKRIEEEIKKLNTIALTADAESAKLVDGLIGSSNKILKGSIAEIEKTLSELNQKYKDAVSDKEREKLAILIREEEKKLEALQLKKPKEQSKDPLKDELEKKKKLYQDYFDWINSNRPDLAESAKTEFESLLKGGNTFIDYLDVQAKGIEGKKNITDDQKKQLKAIREYIAGEVKTTALDTFEKELSVKLEAAKTTLQKMSILDASKPVGGSDLDKAKQVIIDTEKEKTLKQENDLTKELLSGYAGYLQEKIQFNESYAEKKRLLNLAFEKAESEDNKKIAQEGLAELERQKAQYGKLSGNKDYDELISKYKNFKQQLDELLANFDKDIKTALDSGNKELADNILKAKEEEAKKLVSGFGKKEASGYLESLNKSLAINLAIFSVTGKQTAELFKIKELIELINSALKEGNRADIVKTLDYAISSMQEISGLMSDLDENGRLFVGSILNITDAIAKVYSGDVFGGVKQIIFTVADGLDKQFGLQKRIADLEQKRIEYNKQTAYTLESITYELDRQLKKLDELITGEKFKPISDALKNSIGEASKELNSLLFDFAKAPKNVRLQFNLEDLKKLTNTDDAFEALGRSLADGLISQEQYDIAVDYLNTIESAEERLKQLEKERKEQLTGTTSDSIIDSILDGFEQGKRGIEDFADTFEQMMKKAMLQALKMKYLEGPLEQWYETFAAYSEDGLTPEEIEALRKAYNEIITNATEQAKNIEDITGTVTEDKLSGSIKGVSEETAGLLAGQMNAIRINQAHALSLMDDQLVHLSEIASNTRYNRLLVDIKNILQSGSSNSTNTNRANGG